MAIFITEKNIKYIKKEVFMIKCEGLKGTINFSHAIVAVSITLLVIPLTDIFQNFSRNERPSVIGSADFI